VAEGDVLFRNRDLRVTRLTKWRARAAISGPALRALFDGIFIHPRQGERDPTLSHLLPTQPASPPSFPPPRSLNPPGGRRREGRNGGGARWGWRRMGPVNVQE